MHDEVDDLSELKITAYHEAGHAVVAKLLGKQIVFIKLYHTKPTVEQTGGWWGETKHCFDLTWAGLGLDDYLPYAELGLQHPKQDDYTITRAGQVAEELLYKQRGKENNPLLPGCGADIRKVNEWIGRSFPAQEQKREMQNLEDRARNILLHPRCRRMVEYLAENIVYAIEHRKMKPSPGSFIYPTDVYEFGQNRVYGFFGEALNGSNN